MIVGAAPRCRRIDRCEPHRAKAASRAAEPTTSEIHRMLIYTGDVMWLGRRYQGGFSNWLAGAA
jgi:hypothetical protein